MGTKDLLKEYNLSRQCDNLYPKILIPLRIQEALLAEQSLGRAKTADRFGELSGWAVALGAISLATPVGWLGLIGAGAAIFYDSTEGYQERKSTVEEENKRARQILSDPELLRKYMQSQLKSTLQTTRSSLTKSDARSGKYDDVLLNAVRAIPGCLVKKGEGLNLSYTFTPDVILHIPSLNLWIDIEVDEPWFLSDSGQKEPIHYIGKDDYRDQQFYDARWIVIRFAEEQIAKQPASCAKEVAKLLSLFNVDASQLFQTTPDLKPVERWNYETALEMHRY
ncbi:hypothetical protein C7B65_26755 [Phormidesmis priestleyi ULC007]|uniref:DUF559 domain-containing protein n=1 Tax=Phormidesmis priestleyi ULC007 TaxID=1920490 RepID=A0A2T1D0V6_9CYAN|nr:hypothetical protein [Phormidesmis priestleyi]PSB14133.1 hypothetical protein C7B65_26755 [Phormidesmis priestleyi ULC007]